MRNYDKIRERVDYLDLVLAFKDSSSKSTLALQDLCSVRKKKHEREIIKIIIAEDKFSAFCEFCEHMYVVWQTDGLKLLAGVWKQNIKKCKNALDLWNRLVKTGNVYIEWEIKDRYEYEEVPVRTTIPMSGKQKYIKLVKEKNESTSRKPRRKAS